MTILASLVAVPHDICVIGSGPAGIALALECENLGLDVLVLEAGGDTEFSFPRWHGAGADIVDPARHTPLSASTRCALGGTSWAWSGVCVPFDGIDLSVRAHVPYSGWPITASDVAPFYGPAAKFLNCDSACAEATPEEALEPSSELRPSMAELSGKPNLAVSYRDHLAASRKITVCLNSPVVGLALDGTGTRVESITVGNGQAPLAVDSRTNVVVAGGGLRTTQLLLSTQRHWPHLFGGVDGPLGRFYMGHLNGYLASIRFANAADAKSFGSLRLGDRSFARRRWTIRDDVQSSSGLLNAAFWPSEIFVTDPTHGSAALSAVFVAALLPLLGRSLLPAPLRRAYIDSVPWRFSSHVKNLAAHPGRAASAVSNAVLRRVVRGAGRQGVADPRNPAYTLQYHAEHAPNPLSRVTLGSGTDELGLPRMRIDLRYDDRDVRSVLAAHSVLDAALRRSGQAGLEYLVAEERRYDRVLEQATDGYHQIGTTRMGNSRHSSVVDGHGQTHDVHNLYIASSSAFPTSGQANPTLLTVALSIRLAHHLADRQG
jgi:choline dehydrogenase-like flavoprotein